MRPSPVFSLALPLSLFSIAALAQERATAGQPTGKPANLCTELVSFVRQPDASLKADGQPAQLATAVSAPKKGSEEIKPSSAGGSPQSTSGQSGQIGNSGPGAAGPQGATQNSAAPSGATANIAPQPKTSAGGAGQPAQASAQAQPPAAPATPKPTAEDVRKVEAAAGTNDLVGCRSAAQQMRHAGIAMPSPLLALAAMTPKLLQRALEP